MHSIGISETSQALRDLASSSAIKATHTWVYVHTERFTLHINGE